MLIDCSTPFAGYPAVGPDSREGARAARRPSHHRSWTPIDRVDHGRSSEPSTAAREQGWSDAFQAHELPPGPIVRTSFSREGGYEAAQRLLSWPTRPSAIFAASDQLCIGTLKAIREAGLRCPDDIAVVSFDGTTESEYCWPPLTVARQPIQAMAEAAVSGCPQPHFARRWRISASPLTSSFVSRADAAGQGRHALRMISSAFCMQPAGHG